MSGLLLCKPLRRLLADDCRLGFGGFLRAAFDFPEKLARAENNFSCEILQGVEFEHDSPPYECILADVDFDTL